MAITASLTGNITITDGSTGMIALSKALSGLAVTGTSFGEVSPASIGTSPTSISLPVSPTNFVYIKNTHATQTLTITWTPNGGSSNAVVTLKPSSSIILTEAASGVGITALTLTGSGAATSCEYILAG